MDIGSRIFRKNKDVRIENLTALSMTGAVFWDVTPCSRKKNRKKMRRTIGEKQ
jgi:hypothetical protein